MPLLWVPNDRGKTALAEAWLQERIPHMAGGGIGAARYAAVVNEGEALAIVAFHQYDQPARTMQVSMAAESPRWATRRTIAELLAYAFERCGVYKLWTMQPDHEAGRRALRFNEGIGLKREAVLPNQYGPGIGAIVAAMTQPEWECSRWASQ